MNQAIFEISRNSSFSLPFYVTGASNRYKQQKMMRNHDFNHHQITYCCSGSGIIEYDGKSQIVSKDTAFFYSADSAITYYPTASDEAWVVMWITFHGNQIESLLDYIHLKPIEFFDTNLRKIKPLFNACFKALEEEKFLECALILQQILYELYLTKQGTQNDVSRNKKHTQTLLPILRHISSRFAEDVDLDQLAELIGVSKSYLCRIFKATFHQTPIEYLNSHRMTQAKQYLINSPELSVESIARLVGYKESCYFCRKFKANEKLTPSEFRLKYTQ